MHKVLNKNIFCWLFLDSLTFSQKWFASKLLAKKTNSVAHLGGHLYILVIKSIACFLYSYFYSLGLSLLKLLELYPEVDYLTKSYEKYPQKKGYRSLFVENFMPFILEFCKKNVNHLGGHFKILLIGSIESLASFYFLFVIITGHLWGNFQFCVRKWATFFT